MARVILLGTDGKPKKTKDGKDKFMYSVDGVKLVAKGELMEVWDVQNINGEKKRTLVAYRPRTAEDVKASNAAKKAQIAKLKAELGEVEANVEAPEDVEAPESDTDAGFDALDEDDDEKVDPAPSRRTRKPRQPKK